MAFIIKHTNNQVSRQTTENIKLCFPELNEQQQQDLINESILHTSCTFMEAAMLWNRDVNKILSNISTHQLDPAFINSDKARIVIIPHHGSWESINYWLSKQGEFFALYKPSRNEALNNYIFEKRSRNGAKLVATNTAGIRQLLKGLKNKALCAILPDQRPGKSSASMESTFFSQPVSTSLLIKNLASKIDCDIFIAAVTRDLKEASYQLTIESVDVSKILQPDDTSVDYLNQVIQDFISQHISQYQWSYRRFTESAYQSLQR
jgi:Kdo2-lipid IVA lauroyltransferase/acyltransferase